MPNRTASVSLFDTLRLLPETCSEVFEQARRRNLLTTIRPFQNVVIAGVGESAIAGQLFQVLAANSAPFPIVTCRGSVLPAWVGPQTLVIALSATGMAQETVDALSDAVDRKAQVAVVTGGGHLADMAIAQNFPLFTLPRDVADSAATLPAAFFALWGTFLDRFGGEIDSVGGAFDLMRRQRDAFAPERGLDVNPARQLAGAIAGMTVVVHGTSAVSDAAASAWESRFLTVGETIVLHGAHLTDETAASVARAYRHARDSSDRTTLLILRDKSAVTDRRLDLMRQTLNDFLPCHEISLDGKSPQEHLWGALYLADWTAFYLAP